MSQSFVEEPYMSAQEYLELEGSSPFKHEFADGIMYAMHCGSMRDYFELETESPFRHEYMNGVMYAMAGGKKPHHVISRNLGGMLYNRLDGHPCTNTTANMKLKLPSQDPEEAELCYPDEMISCDPTDEGETKGHAWIQRPTVIFEITSASTRRIDEGDKRDAYLTIPSLQAYVRI
jgi:Uma2 family endonuclease